jgi:hypothetical protein
MIKPLLNIERCEYLFDILWPEFIEINGTILIKEFYQNSSWPSEDDSIGIESLINHLHILDLFKHNADLGGKDDKFYDDQHKHFKIAIKIGHIIAKSWTSKLKEDFPDYKFRVYLTLDDNPIIRFHKIRVNMPNWIDDKDIDGYKTNLYM